MIDKHKFEELSSFIKSRLDNLNSIDQLMWVGEYDPDDYDDRDYTSEKIGMIADALGAIWGDCGCTKSVFQFKEYPDYVFKIPFMGRVHLIYDEDDYYFYESEDFDVYCNAGHNNDHHDWDYCETEARLYHAACEYNLDMFFAGTYFLCKYSDYPIYVSEYRKDYYTTCKSSDEVSKSIAKELDEKYCSAFWSEDLANLIEFTNVDTVEKLLSFIEEFGIDDLHRGNLGSTKDGMLCIIDYSNYNE